jgi:hypothetical protein
MASELRVNTITSTTGVGTVTLGSGGVSFSGTPTFNDVTLSSINGNAISGARNRIINGNFDIWQRGTSSSSTGYQTADRFRYSDNGTSITIAQSQQTFTIGQTDVPGEPTYFYRIAKTVAGSSGTFTAIEQGIEDVRTLAGQTATISFYAKTTSGTVSCSVYLAQYFGSGGSSNVNTSSTSLTLTTTWQKFTATVSVPSISGKTIGTGSALFFTLLLPNNATFTADLAQVQVEAGSVPTPFERRSFGQELALCQRYCYFLPAHYHFLHKNSYYESQLYYFPVTMRSAPNITDNGSWVLRGFQAGSDTTYSGFSYTTYTDGFYLGSTTTNNNTFYTWVHNSALIIASAEL